MTAPTPVVSVRNLVKHFPVGSRGVLRRRVGVVHAVCDLSLDLNANETLGLVGESGCGKTTTGRVLLNLVRATSGEVRYGGRDLTALSPRQMRPLRRELQIVFQDPFASLDPRMTINEIVAEPLRIHRRYGSDGQSTAPSTSAGSTSPSCVAGARSVTCAGDCRWCSRTQWGRWTRG